MTENGNAGQNADTAPKVGDVVAPAVSKPTAVAPKNTLVVGIGASAGGIQALKAFFSTMPDNPDMTFVVVTHLSPERASLLHEVIGHFTTLPVSVIKDGDAVMPGTVHVMPENAILSIRDGKLRLIAPDPLRRERKPVDVFLAALAADQGDRAIGIVLSGGDGDGTLGVKAIKQNGGFTFAQTADGGGPNNPEMPASAIASGWVDFALPADQMPEKLVQIQRDAPRLVSLLRRGETGAANAEEKRLQNEIAQLLRTHSRHDFTGYKSKTFFRRVARRMQVTHMTTPEAYLGLLRRDPAEVMALFRDLLISVTDFFRDAEAFDALATQVIPKLLHGRGADETVRIWVPGCATGEEVYSLAILMREQMHAMSPHPQVKIFATDIDELALSVARAARYPQELLKDLSQERKAQFFRKDGASYVLAPEVRDMCIFSPHSITSDPPFSRMDLISCRNLLIYLGRALQEQVISTFHYALKPGGYLFLGMSESISQHEDLFAPIDKKQRIFQSRDLSDKRPRIPIGIQKMEGAHQRFDREKTTPSPTHSNQLRLRVMNQLTDRHSPAHVVIRAEGDIVYYSARTGRYLDIPSGAPTRQLFDIARHDLRPDLRAALRDAQKSAQSVTRQAMMSDGEKGQLVALTVEPLGGGNGDDALFLVLFQPGGVAGEDLIDARRSEAGQADTRATERELREVRDRLRGTVEEYETALEELKSTNEELVSVDEEAQSTNEELQASKEEMQSLNEELSTVNTELNDKVDELDRANVDLKNLYEATGIATVFLDKDLMIRNFTPAASTFFMLRRSDIGRPLTELAGVIEYTRLKDDISGVFESGEIVEHRLAPNDLEGHFLVRSTPYFDDDKITGVVVTFVEITNLAKAEEQQNILIAELNHRVKNMLAVVLSIVRATQKSATSVAGFTEAPSSRLHSMAGAYGLVASRSWADVPLYDLVEQEIAAFDENRIEIRGPQVLLCPEQALAFGMVIHELATNAAKHGALSVPGGCVSIDWSTSDGQLHLTWKESDGPKIESPKHGGFGLKLLQGQIEGQLGGTASISFPPGGFVAEMKCAMKA
ncbi:CheR family methyltransferase [Roseinatronobacter monicus]|uniref:histidine kinase n=1 Tax=Roseinatronobacter monicus TaxID=393481 RepID=A0A543K477_9RHOB|nr:CheR family methyltransferase [Roseinatronobacter monicus]TQM89876.1 two-component system CheB/CheR fusion protein [Roseinatronobacter monicus]